MVKRKHLSLAYDSIRSWIMAPSTRAVAAMLLLVAVVANLVSADFKVPINPFEEKQAPLQGRVCAFGDFNGDRTTDIIVQNGTKLEVVYQGENGIFPSPKTKDPEGEFYPLSFELGTAEPVECSLGDLNGDGFLDVVVSRQLEKDKKWEVRVFYRIGYIEKDGKPDATFREAATKLLAKHQVVALDVNGDGVHDILGVTPKDELLCVLGGTAGTLTENCTDLIPDWKGQLHPRMPILYADVTGDYVADLIFPMEDEDDHKKLSIQIWTRGSTNWAKFTLDPPKEPSGVDFRNALSPVVDDLNRDGIMEISIPICKGWDCKELDSIYALSWNYTLGVWNDWLVFPVEMQLSEFLPEETLSWLRIGDYSLDGFPDFVVSLRDKQGAAYTNTFLLMNEEMPDSDTTKPIRRKFVLKRQPRMIQPLEVALYQSLEASYFFDLKEDGCLDILVQYKTNTSVTKFDFIPCGEKGDTTFLKIQIFTPQSGEKDKLTEGTQKGVAWGGACIHFDMEAAGRETINSGACQLASASHRSFMLPFTLFGLGRSPNFVDHVHIGTPRNGEEKNVKHELKQIVPNSRLMVLPPLTGTTWFSRLYVTPSTLIIQSLLVMAAVCVILLLVVLLLHFREKKEDRVERQAQSHLFHFDAM